MNNSFKKLIIIFFFALFSLIPISSFANGPYANCYNMRGLYWHGYMALQIFRKINLEVKFDTVTYDSVINLNI